MLGGCLIVLLAAPLSAEETVQGGLRRQAEYSGLWPFFSHEVFEDGSEKWMSLLGAVQAESSPNGDWHHHVLPFYCASLGNGQTDRQLALYPLLYLRRRSPESSYDTVLPLFSSWESGTASHTLLWPLFHVATNPEPVPFRWIPTLFRHGAWDDTGSSAQRLGVPILLELFEHARGRDTEAWTVANLFNLSHETESGLPWMEFRRSADGGQRSHVFPLYFRGESGAGSEDSYFHTILGGTWTSAGGERGFVFPPLLSWWRRNETSYNAWALFPLAHFRADPDGYSVHVAPLYFAGESFARSTRYHFYSLFYGTIEGSGGETRDSYIPLFLSHYGVDPGGYAIDVLFPLGHYSESDRGSGSFAVRALPFYDRVQNGEGDWLGVGGFLYRRHESFTDGSLSQWGPWPLVHWKTSLDDDLAWALPIFYRRNETIHEGDLPGSVKTLAIAPSFFSRVASRSWKTTEGKFDQTSADTHFWPLFGRGVTIRTQTTPEGAEGLRWEENRYSTLFPLLQLERSTSSLGDGSARLSLDAPWPFVSYRHDATSFDFRFFPPLYAGAESQRAYFYLYPAVSVEDGPSAEEGFWHSTSIFQWYGGDDEQRFQVFPLLFHWRVRSDRFRSIAGPLYVFYYSTLPSSGWFYMVPLGFGAWSETSSAFGIFPLYFQSDRGPEPIDYWNPGRFFFLWNTLRSDGERHWSLLWKLMEETSSPGGDYDFRILHRLFVARSVKGQEELVINPILQTYSDAQTGRSSFSIFKFLYRSETEGGMTTRSILFIPIWRG
jgi:hypothetical protein